MIKELSAVDQVVKFVQDYSGREWTDEQVREEIEKHIAYGTCVILSDLKGITAVCGWNIEGERAEVLELIVRPDCRNKKLIPFITALGWKKFPFLKFIKFKRERKYQGRKPRVYLISRLLGGK